ncbi:peptide-methionine (S)-S-oxide reductase MsrA [Lactococcus paracarnosus]|nr:peptide-methionine (S)-S-oxide reductase MsrA [Lactococcus paracarnosus]
MNEMTLTKEAVLNDIYNLILNPGTRDWERSVLIIAKDELAVTSKVKVPLKKLELALRPLALRSNLTPDLADFYLKITDQPIIKTNIDLAKHTHQDLPYEARAVFAGGCFWCMVEPFETKPGIISVLSGYTGGHVDHPTYDQILGGYTGHVEAVEIIFDTRLITYDALLDLFWLITDPTDAFGQFQDRGEQYKSVIFVADASQKALAQQSKQRLISSGRYEQPIVTEIRDVIAFWPAEDYHQQFYQKQKKRYGKIKKSRQQLIWYLHQKRRLQKFFNRFRKTS